MMISSSSTRRVLLANNTKLVSRTLAQQRRVYLTNARPPPGSAQHARGYRSSLQNPYFTNPVVVLEAPSRTGAQQQQQQGAWWRQAWAWYGSKLESHPLITKSLTGAVIAAAGDVLCQAGTYKDQEKRPFWTGGGWDIRRSMHFFVLGFAFVAPSSHYFYGNMAIHPWTRGQTFAQISKRVALDQFVWSPVFFVIWLTGFWGLEKNGNITAGELKKDLSVALPDVMVANWLLWIPCQYANCKKRKYYHWLRVSSCCRSHLTLCFCLVAFPVYAVPVKYQVLFTNVVELVWNAYLSFATEGGGHGHGGGGGHEQSEDSKKEEL